MSTFTNQATVIEGILEIPRGARLGWSVTTSTPWIANGARKCSGIIDLSRGLQSRLPEGEQNQTVRGEQQEGN